MMQLGRKLYLLKGNTFQQSTNTLNFPLLVHIEVISCKHLNSRLSSQFGYHLLSLGPLVSEFHKSGNYYMQVQIYCFNQYKLKLVRPFLDTLKSTTFGPKSFGKKTSHKKLLDAFSEISDKKTFGQIRH